jgi:biotin operon repressor
MSKRVREYQISFLQQIKPLLSTVIVKEGKKEVKTIGINELLQRIERIEKMLEKSQKIEGVRKAKVKEQIISLLKEHKKLSSSQLSKLIGLSRTRCNEYFRELTKEGLTEGIIIGRRKYYKLVGK